MAGRVLTLRGLARHGPGADLVLRAITWFFINSATVLGTGPFYPSFTDEDGKAGSAQGEVICPRSVTAASAWRDPVFRSPPAPEPPAPPAEAPRPLSMRRWPTEADGEGAGPRLAGAGKMAAAANGTGGSSGMEVDAAGNGPRGGGLW